MATDDGDTIRAGVGRLALGYCLPASVVAGEDVAVHASAPGGTVDVEVVRDGAEPEVVWRASGVAVGEHGLADDTPERGCGWPAALSIPVGDAGDGWRPGLHLVRLRRAGAAEPDPPTAFFVVRSAAPRPGRAVLALATNTWNAYNDAGGRNLYTGAVELSSARPLALGMLAKPAGHGERLVHGVGPYARYSTDHGLGLWHGMAGWAGQERAFVAWAERRGVELDFATNADVERVPGLLDGAALLLSVGHDEYWSAPMRDAVEAFADGGGNVAFLSGNTCYWQVRLEGDVMVAWKHRFAEDPVHGTDRAHLTTTMWADPLLDRPEAALTGVSFTRGGYARTAGSVPAGSGGYEVHRPGHWLLEGTGLARGDVLGGGEAVAVGYECDGCDLELRHGLPVATGLGGTPAGFEVVATAPATPFDAETTPLPLAPGGEYELEFHARRLLADTSPAALDRLRAGHAVLGTYRRRGPEGPGSAGGPGAGGTVVTTGCTEWAHALGDPAVDRVTRTILRTLAPPTTG